jgi:hypothetical protein
VPPLLIIILHPLFCNGRCGHGAYCILLCPDDGTLLFQSLFHDFHIPLTTDQLVLNIWKMSVLRKGRWLEKSFTYILVKEFANLVLLRNF